MTRTAIREKLIEVGTDIISQQGFNTTGLNTVLSTAGVPKGSFYHYFQSKEGFGLAVIDEFGETYNEKMKNFLQNKRVKPLNRIRNYMEAGIQYMNDCSCAKGCLIGSLSQELAGQNELFRQRLAQIFDKWQSYLVECLQEAKDEGAIAADSNTKEIAELILIGWQGANLRAKVSKSTQPMKSFMNFMFNKVLV